MTYLEKLEELIKASDELAKGLAELAQAQREHPGTEVQPDEQAPPKHPGGSGVHIAKVEIIVSSNEDPDRIARLALAHLERLRRMP